MTVNAPRAVSMNLGSKTECTCLVESTESIRSGTPGRWFYIVPPSILRVIYSSQRICTDSGVDSLALSSRIFPRDPQAVKGGVREDLID